MRYKVINTANWSESSHRTWDAAMKAAAKHDPDHVMIEEYDGRHKREYNAMGQQLDEDGHYC